MVPGDARRLCISPRAPLLTRAMNDLELNAVLLGVGVAQRFRAFDRAGLRSRRLSDAALYAALEAHAQGRLAREGIAWLLEHLLTASQSESISAADVRQALDELNLGPATEREINERLDRALADADAARFATPEKRVRWVMGRLMRELIGRAAGRRLLALVRDRLQMPAPEGIPA